VIAALGRITVATPEGALGILESFNVSTLIKAADAAAKNTPVQLLEVRVAMALGGKAFVTMTGDAAAVQSAMVAGRDHLRSRHAGDHRCDLRPHPDVYREVDLSPQSTLSAVVAKRHPTAHGIGIAGERRNSAWPVPRGQPAISPPSGRIIPG